MATLYTQTDLLNMVWWLKPNVEGFRYRIYRWLRKKNTTADQAMRLRRQLQEELAEYSRGKPYDFVQDGMVRILGLIESYAKKLYFKQLMPKLLDKYGLFYNSRRRSLDSDLNLKWEKFTRKVLEEGGVNTLKMDIKRQWEKEAIKAAY